MAYRIRCNNCMHNYTSANRYAECPRCRASYHSSSILEDLAEVAIAAAVAYVAGDVISDVASSGVDSLFDW